MIGKSVLEYAQEESKKSRSFRNFVRGISRDTTKTAYVKFMKAFMDFHNVTDYDVMAKMETRKIDEMFEDYIDDFESRDVKGITIKTNLAGIERFFIMNDCIWHKERIRKSIRRDDAMPGGRVPITTPEVKRMLECTKSLRIKALVHFLSSTGIRPAGMTDPVLKLKHLVDMPKPGNDSIKRWCYGIKVYDESKEGYWAFLTPEASKALDDYFSWREIRGERLTQESPIFANIENNRHTKFGHITDKNARFIMEGLIKASALQRKKVGKRRYDKSIMYMFRKRFNGILKINNEVNSNIAEKLMAHKKGLDGTYLQPTLQECYAEFVKAVSELTVDSTERQQILLNKKQDEINELKEMKAREVISSPILKDLLGHKLEEMGFSGILEKLKAQE